MAEEGVVTLLFIDECIYPLDLSRTLWRLVGNEADGWFASDASGASHELAGNEPDRAAG